MEGLSIIIPVFNGVERTLRCIDRITEQNRGGCYEIIIFDNGSTDETRAVLSRDGRIRYMRHEDNIGISAACNSASKRAVYDHLCFMHNDVFLFERDWVSKITDFLCRTPGAGVIGLYGAKRIRRDGSFRGRTIVHSKRGDSMHREKHERVAVVDGLLTAMNGVLFNEIGGFNEAFTVHFYDKDISLRVLQRGYDNYVLPIPFEHLCGSTRKEIRTEEREREEAKRRFLELWEGLLPVDVSTWRERLSYIFGRTKQV